MTRQLFLKKDMHFMTSLGILLFSCCTFASPPANTTYVVPSPQTETAPSVNPEVIDPEQKGLDSSFKKEIPEHVPLYHVEPRPSFTLALSRAYEVVDQEHSGWIGLHVAPWMTATTRIQLGLDIHEKVGWFQAAIHSLPTRNLYRLYWGGGLSTVINSDRELRPLIEINSYHAFGAFGWEFQMIELKNIRFEVSYHQGPKTGFAKVLVGYTQQL